MLSDEKVYMMNAVWFKSEGGEKRFREYLKALTPLIKKVGGRRLKSFVPDRELIGDFDADLLFFIEYPDKIAFKCIANSPDYHQIAYIREEAVEKSLLIQCIRPESSFWREA